jgi:pre-mRNA-splicing factor 38A
MANRTVKDAKSIKGTNPQYLVEKIIRTRIYDCKYWKEECFALSGKKYEIEEKPGHGLSYVCI